MSFRFQNLLGDFNEGNYPTLSNPEQKRLIEKCIKKLDDTVQDKTQSVLVTSDSRSFLEAASRLDYVYAVSGRLVHMDFVNNKNEGYEMHKKAFIDFFMLMNARKVYLFQTESMYHSLFPYTAALMGGKEYVEIIF